METIKTETPIGTIIAEVAQDPDHPGIFIWIERKDGTILDLTAVEYMSEYVEYGTETPNSYRPRECGTVEKEVIAGYTYGDVQTEDWTRRHIWTKEEIEKVE